MVQYILELARDGMSYWRGVDNMLTSAILQKLQKEIDRGKPWALEWVSILGRTVEERKERYNAWRIFMLDRMMAEYDKGKMGDINPEQEVMEDLALTTKP